jgi:hypothetical protein
MRPSSAFDVAVPCPTIDTETGLVRPLRIEYDWNKAIAVAVFENNVSPWHLNRVLAMLTTRDSDWRIWDIINYPDGDEDEGFRVPLMYTGGSKKRLPLSQEQRPEAKRLLDSMLNPQDWRSAEAYVNFQRTDSGIISGFVTVELHGCPVPQDVTLRRINNIPGVLRAAVVGKEVRFSLDDLEPDNAISILNKTALLLNVEYTAPPKVSIDPVRNP